MNLVHVFDNYANQVLLSLISASVTGQLFGQWRNNLWLALSVHRQLESPVQTANMHTHTHKECSIYLAYVNLFLFLFFSFIASESELINFVIHKAAVCVCETSIH